jgi:hypothetical protein
LLLNGTPIAVSATATKAVQDLLVGDTLLAAGLTRDWKAATVRFSTGMSPGSRFTAIRLEMDGGRELIGALIQFVLTDRGLVAMKRIIPGDQLIGADGQGVEVRAVTVGLFRLGEHAIATSPQPTKDPEGHLLLAQGFIIADYALSMGLAADSLKTLARPGEEADQAQPPA